MKMRNRTVESWVNRYSRHLYYRALSKVSGSESARDLVQDTFLTAVEKFSTFKEKSSPQTWLMSILNHKIVDHYRKKSRQPVLFGDENLSDFFQENGDWRPDKQPADWHDEDENLLDNEEFLTILKKCMDALPVQWKDCISLKYLLDKKGEEICQELEITPSNYWQITRRAKLQLRECIEKKWLK